MTSDQRPLSPHLQVYRPQWSSVLSILHRITGAAISVGLVLVVWWLTALASGPEAFSTAMGWLTHPISLVVLAAASWALFYHLFNGIRHLVWDAGMLLDVPSARRSGWIVVALSLIVTAVVWGVAL